MSDVLARKSGPINAVLLLEILARTTRTTQCYQKCWNEQSIRRSVDVKVRACITHTRQYWCLSAGTYNPYNAVLVSKCGHVQPIQCSILCQSTGTYNPYNAVLVSSWIMGTHNRHSMQYCSCQKDSHVNAVLVSDLPARTTTEYWYQKYGDVLQPVLVSEVQQFVKQNWWRQFSAMHFKSYTLFEPSLLTLTSFWSQRIRVNVVVVI